MPSEYKPLPECKPPKSAYELLWTQGLYSGYYGTANSNLLIFLFFDCLWSAHIRFVTLRVLVVHWISPHVQFWMFIFSLGPIQKNLAWNPKLVPTKERKKSYASINACYEWQYSKTCLKRTCSKADTWLKRTKFLEPAVFWSNPHKITSIKRTL